ncbi:MAG: hypothetical protein JWR35_2151 [Marmoricola sp.]|nr:hypothetical protein [Marmoricola sp.]
MRSRLDPTTLGLMAVGVLAVSLSGPVMASLVVPALAISFWRNGFATVAVAPFALSRARRELRGLTRRQLGLILLSGGCLAAHFGFWVTSLTMTSVASSTAIVCLQIIWVVAWDRTQGIRLPGKAILGIAVAFIGAVVVSGVDFQASTRALVGDVFALIGSIAIAGYSIIGGRARQSASTTAYTFVCYGTAAMVLLVAALVSGQQLVGYAPKQWLLILLVAATAQLMGHSVFNYLLSTISPMVVSLALLLEIPGAALIAAAWLHQVPSVAAVGGLLLILLGMVLVVLNNRSTPEEAPMS